jgi:nucleoid DNA-binding protein
MNLTRIIEETGKRVRLGKIPADRLTNAEVKAVLETAIEVLKAGLLAEGRVEIQDFAVIEVKSSLVKSTKLHIYTAQGQKIIPRQEIRIRWIIRPSRFLKKTVKQHISEKS